MKDMSEEKEYLPPSDWTQEEADEGYKEWLQRKTESLESRLKVSEKQSEEFHKDFSRQVEITWDLESRLREAERQNKGFQDQYNKSGEIIVELRKRLSQAEAENQVLRDENIAYNKNYLKLMDVAGKMAECLLNVQIDLEDMIKDRHTDGVLADVIETRAEWVKALGGNR